MSPVVMLAVFGAVFLWWYWRHSGSALVLRIKGVHAQRARFRALGANVDLTVVASRGHSAERLIHAAREEMRKAWAPFAPSDPRSLSALLAERATTGTLVLGDARRAGFDLLARAAKITGLMRGACPILALDSPRLPGPRPFQVDERAVSVMFNQAGLHYDLAPVARGMAVDRTLLMLAGAGAQGALLNVDGDVKAFGRRADGKFWRVGLENIASREPDLAPGLAFSLRQGGAVVCDASEDTPLLVGGEDKSVGSRAVVVFAPSMELARGLARALRFMSVASGRAYIDKLEWAEALWVDATMRVHGSSGMPEHVSRTRLRSDLPE